MAFTGLTGPLPRDPATGALQISVAGGAAQEFTADQLFSGKVGIGVDPATPGAKKLSVAQTGVTDWLVSLGSDWNVLTAFHAGYLSAGDMNPHDLVDLFLSSTGDAIFAAHQGGKVPAFTFTATKTSGSPTLSSVSSYTGLVAGTGITGTGIPAGTTVLTTPNAAQVAAGTLTMSQNATSSGSITVSVAAPSGSAGGNALFNGLVPYYVDDTSTGRAGQIVNNRTDMKGLFIQTQAPNSGVYGILLQHAGNAPAIQITNQDPSTLQGAAGQGTGGPLVIDDFSTASGISFSKQGTPGTGNATLKLGTTIASAIDAIRVNNSSGSGRFLVRADGSAFVGLDYPTQSPLAVQVQIEKAGSGVQRALGLTNNTSADGNGVQIEADIAGTQYVVLQGVADSVGGGNGSWRLRVRAGGALTERFRADGTGVGFFGVTPVAKPTLSAAATDLATVITLANDLRTRLINYGLGA
jgi:hypothetical protein